MWIPMEILSREWNSFSCKNLEAFNLVLPNSFSRDTCEQCAPSPSSVSLQNFFLRTSVSPKWVANSQALNKNLEVPNWMLPNSCIFVTPKCGDYFHLWSVLIPRELVSNSIFLGRFLDKLDTSFIHMSSDYTNNYFSWDENMV